MAALEKATVPVEWVKTASALRSRLERSDLPRPTLVMVLPSRQRSLPPAELARVVLRLTMNARRDLGTQEGRPLPLGRLAQRLLRNAVAQRPATAGAGGCT